MTDPTKPTRHICGISGGKDSAALAIYMRDRVPEMEYFFCDTEKELPETYDYLARLEAYLGKPIARLNATKGFDHWLKIYGGYLPSSQMRWCTRMLKIRPFEEWVGDDAAVSYVGIRADENRSGYVSTKPNIVPVFPFRDDGLIKDDIFRILDESGVGIPEYYKWRSRSGCYFCFFQRKVEWIGLKENHPDLWEQAKAYEKPGPPGEPGFYWTQDEPLTDLEDPERATIVARRAAEADLRAKERRANLTLLEALGDEVLEDEDAEGCLMCHV
jgi:3'-phosphoadenosine 5'-phosphosulfate sulfotransferase (PAPS reductase)/FAD synthetase